MVEIRPCPFSAPTPEVRDIVLQQIFSMNALHHPVILCGLKNAKALNGKQGTVAKATADNVEALFQSRRVCVKMASGVFKSIKPANLKLTYKSESGYLRRDEIEHMSKLLLGQLVSGPGGETGNICGYDHRQRMFEVELSPDKKKKYKPEDLEPTDVKIEPSEPSREK